MSDAFSVSCPHCFTSIAIKDRSLIGRKGRCPGCKETFTVKDPDVVEEEDSYSLSSSEDDDFLSEAVAYEQEAKAKPQSRRRHPGIRESPLGTYEAGGSRKRRREAGDNLGGVRIGINLIVAQLIGFLFLFALVALELGGARIGLPPQILIFGGLGVYVLGFTGKAFCLTAPAATGGREFIFVAMFLEVVSFGLGFAGGFLGMGILTTIGNIVGLLGGITYLWFLGELAQYVERRDLADIADSCVNLAMIAFVIGGILWLALFLFKVLFFAFLFFIPLGMAIMIMIRYIILVLGLRGEL